jgi:diguanylate cyclase (GGDEF)-like protein/PAS domain S-box-containing protein
MADRPGSAPASDQAKRLRKLERALQRAEERLVDYERIVDQTQHLLNTRIDELEQARSALRARSDDLAESENRFRQLAEAAFEAILICHGDRVIDCNDAATALYGQPKEGLVDGSILELVEPEAVAAMQQQLADPPAAPFESRHLRHDRTIVPVEVRVRQIHYRGEDILVLAVRDITEHKAMEASLRHLASTDPLTGVSNRRHFFDLGRAELARAQRYGATLTVMMLDVDHFKQVNDRFGHDVGDLALQALTASCAATLRASDLLGRLGGEEFALLLPSTPLAAGLILAERIRAQVERMRLATPKGGLAFTVSVGVCNLTAADTTFDVLLKRADQALYAAKEGGRNRVVEGC